MVVERKKERRKKKEKNRKQTQKTSKTLGRNRGIPKTQLCFSLDQKQNCSINNEKLGH
jgi:uncharacterized FlaG/YvyC family protein